MTLKGDRELRWEKFKRHHPGMAAWIESNKDRDKLARSLYFHVRRFGELSRRQVSSVCYNMERQIIRQRKA